MQWSILTYLNHIFDFQLFADDFIEDVYLVNDAVKSLLEKFSQSQEESNAEDKQQSERKIWSRAVDAVLLRHRLLKAAHETEIISK